MTNEQKVKHLHWRAGFGLNAQQWQQRRTWTIERSVDALFADSGRADLLPVENDLADLTQKKVDRMSEKTKKEKRKEQKLLVVKHARYWVNRMADPKEADLLERMSLFWHGHFACHTKLGHLAATQLNTIRQHALGNFRDLVLAIARDVSMIRYLNNQQNKKQAPNENFARELMELFTLGRGHYSETDIKEAARAFTGWSSNMSGEFVFRKNQHDYGSKTFFGNTGTWDGTDIIDFILAEKQCARFICGKVFTYFVHSTPNETQIEELTKVFFDSNYDIGSLMRYLFLQDWFYSPGYMGNKIKSPVELVAGLLRQFNGQVNSHMELFKTSKALGQVLFSPPNVAGWPGGKAWVDNSTLLLRLSLGAVVFQAGNIDFEIKEEAESSQKSRKLGKLDVTLDLAPLQQIMQGKDALTAGPELSTFLLGPGLQVQPHLLQMETNGASGSSLIRNLCVRLMSLPEYQLC